VWAQAADDLVAPEGLLPDDDEGDTGEEDDIAEADADEEAPAPSRDEPVPTASAVEGAASPAVATAPGLAIPGILLAAVLAVQVSVAVWMKLQTHAAAFAPVFGFAAMLVLAIGALFVLGRGATDKVGLRPFTSFQFLMLLFAAAPTSVLAAQLGNLIAHLCDTQSFPAWLRPPVTVEFPHLALAIAGLCVVPALAQELAFRGVIGRSLTAKFGAFIGMLLTCVAFAAAYVFPEWIARAFVVTIALQLVFLATRSLAATMVLNALCAAAVVLAQRFAEVLSIPGYSHPHVSPFVAWELLAASVTVLAAILAALYLTRTRFLTIEGKGWTPGYCSLERPPRDAAVQLHSTDAHGGLVILVVAIFACFIVVTFREAERGAKAVADYNRSKIPVPTPPPQTPMSPPPNGGLPPGMGKGFPGGKPKGKPGGKAPFGKRPQEPLAEGPPVGSGRPRRPEGQDPAGQDVVRKPVAEDRIPQDKAPSDEQPRRPEIRSQSPESLSADPLPVDVLPPAREPAS
jgi:membrane protease YdiL (CAAX protease family)